MKNLTNYNVKIHSGAKTPFKVDVNYTAVNNVQQIIKGTVQTAEEIALRIEKAIEQEFNR
jgi:hypothetical protein